jgi:hypothetical protein
MAETAGVERPGSGRIPDWEVTFLDSLLPKGVHPVPCFVEPKRRAQGAECATREDKRHAVKSELAGQRAPTQTV